LLNLDWRTVDRCFPIAEKLRLIFALPSMEASVSLESSDDIPDEINDCCVFKNGQFGHIQEVLKTWENKNFHS
jgi:hypothetical protein